MGYHLNYDFQCPGCGVKGHAFNLEQGTHQGNVPIILIFQWRCWVCGIYSKAKVIEFDPTSEVLCGPDSDL